MKHPLCHYQITELVALVEYCPSMSIQDAIKYRILIEHIPAITYIAAMDEASSTLYTSPQIKTLLGFSQDEWMAEPDLWFKQIHSEDRAYVRAELDRIHAGDNPKPCEYRMLTRDGQVVWFRDEAAVQRNERGQQLFLYGVLLDITARKLLAAELSQTQSLLRESIRDKFTDRELTLLRLIQEGKTDRQISEEIAICERTVSYCLRAIYSKLGVKKRIEAVRKVTSLGLLDRRLYLDL
jgi:PAS domain S-box-containing protein